MISKKLAPTELLSRGSTVRVCSGAPYEINNGKTFLTSPAVLRYRFLKVCNAVCNDYSCSVFLSHKNFSKILAACLSNSSDG